MSNIFSKMRAYVALPAMDEYEQMPRLLENLEKQQSKYEFELTVCVNQPDIWWKDKKKKFICGRNVQTLNYLRKFEDQLSFPIKIIDRCTTDHGWKGKSFGVGWARKTIMDDINSRARNEDIIISLDVDTVITPPYINSVVEALMRHPSCTALSNPYYHLLTGDERADRAILHYEIYMRCYAIQMTQIESPYNFTAIGSSMAFPVWAYRKAGGITPHKSGEDFYFLQKLRKIGDIINYNTEKTYPAARFSDRVFFGTGPAMIKGAKGDWSSYPIFDPEFFREVKNTYEKFPALFFNDKSTPMDEFLEEKFSGRNLWTSLRKNYKKQENFIKACHGLIDGLRVLQYLKWRHSKQTSSDEYTLLHFISKTYSDEISHLKIDQNNFSFNTSPITLLDRIRNFLSDKEEQLQMSAV